MRLLHHTPEPLVLDRARQYVDESDRHHKPTGFWVSVDGEYDWRSWCEGEGYLLDRLIHTAEVFLRPDANILRIESISALDDFHAEYAHNYEKEYHAIRWADVKSKWDGILIAPYRWERRLELNWYYTWDCASGCIWNLQAIQAVHALQESPA